MGCKIFVRKVREANCGVQRVGHKMWGAQNAGDAKCVVQSMEKYNMGAQNDA